MFMLIGSAEKAGSGVDKILTGWADAKWKRPYIEEYDHPDKLVLTMPTVSLLSPDVIKELQAAFGQEITRINRDKLLTLATCRSEGCISNDRLQQVIDRHSADITKLFKELCKDGYIIPTGNGRGTKYHLNIDFGKNNVGSSIEKVGSSANNVGSSQRGWMTREQLEQQICECCQDYCSIEEIALSVNRSIDYLKNKILPKTIQRGQLIRQYPDKPTHPLQKFKAEETA